ncbi:glycosyltransferase family 4 protein [Rhodococcus koreensis]|uniref:glycosyltransferase family 4 protein n=1 Tax=Rhodococcus koreensis TaxID=99653 RepID=UPI00197F367E|nr:glycosyltransferase family 4 protein [Rhodococcus koreensis]QSE87078.1 glycosyltransferase family 4 protein [Rhodococcus koreensis]
MSDEPVRVLVVSPNPSGNAGGVERFCTMLVDVVTELGWEARVIGPPSPRSLDSRLGISELKARKHLAHQCRDYNPDLVITNGLLAFRSECPRIHVYHGTIIDHMRANGRAQSWHNRARKSVTLGLAEYLGGRGAFRVSVSDSASREVAQYYRFRSDAIIPNGVDTDLFNSRQSKESAARRLGLQGDRPRALFVGRLEPRKGADLLVETCEKAGFDLLVAGNRAPASAVALGVLTPEQMAVAYRASDAVIFPSRYEACSFVVLEALSCGVPLVTSNVGFIETLLDAVPEYDQLIAAPDSTALAGRLRSVATTDTSEVSRRGQQFVSKIASREAFSARWEQIMRKVVADAR